MLPILVLHPAHSPMRGRCGWTRPGGRVPADRFSPSRESRLPVSSFQRALTHPRLVVLLLWPADFPGHFLPGISPDKSVLLPGTTAAFTSVTEPEGFAVLCPFVASRPAFYAVSVRRPTGFP